MTTATDLLPLPEGDAAWYYIGSTHVYSADEMESYARANVAHATATLQAEIEALRAEVERLQGYVHEADRRVGEQFMAAQDADAHRLRVLHDRLLDVKRAEAAEARADRLEEALRRYGVHDQACVAANIPICTCGLDAALEQEEGHEQ